MLGRQADATCKPTRGNGLESGDLCSSFVLPFWEAGWALRTGPVVVNSQGSFRINE